MINTQFKKEKKNLPTDCTFFLSVFKGGDTIESDIVFTGVFSRTKF